MSKVYSLISENIVICLSIGTPYKNKFSICPEREIYHFKVSQNLGTLQPDYSLLK